MILSVVPRLSLFVGESEACDHVYLNAVDAAFDREIDYAMIVKEYGNSPESEKRYSPAPWRRENRSTGASRPKAYFDKLR